MNKFSGALHGKTVLITGGSSGIGLALADLASRAGAYVWLLARDREKLEKACAGLATDGGQNHGLLSADVGDWGQVSAAIEQVQLQAGTPDIVINSAGETFPGYVQDIGQDVFHRLMDSNYFGTVHVIKAVLPGMLERGSGHIVNISSAAGFLGVFGYSAYGASKYAVRGLSDVLRAELKPHGIRVSIVFPPDTDTPQLAYEASFKPAETKAIAGNASVQSAQAVARAILVGVQRGRYVILPGMDVKLIYTLHNLLGNGVYPIMDMLISRARRGKKS